ncbi:MAG: GNAT family N-acetyltransferase, partial [Fulvivirga sp.]
MSNIHINLIDNNDKNIIDQVIELGDKNSSTLGHFPKGAFEDKARKRHIITLTKDGVVIGYLLFNTVLSKRALSITHLCINEKYRSQGLAEKLIDKLINIHGTAFSFIKLNCRDDYKGAVKFWRNYGFTPRHTKPSRGKSDNFITTWVYELNNHDLFSFSEPSGIKVLLDLNIIVDLRDGKNDEYEIQTLTADWLTNDVNYYCSSESFLEAQNDSDVTRRNK